MTSLRDKSRRASLPLPVAPTPPPSRNPRQRDGERAGVRGEHQHGTARAPPTPPTSPRASPTPHCSPTPRPPNTNTSPAPPPSAPSSSPPPRPSASRTPPPPSSPAPAR